ncbi:MAG: aminotransferase class I/II-fold pyridoxal phosphate-dependent enzyme [Blastocatellia bacterium]|nr:aminotransferase class I/II-fold pyridoxal phosphate-dependent enzyme [Blastocatellia bacterium]
MQLAPFLLDQWLNQYHFADPPVEYDLASSTGPSWILKELIDSFDEDERRRFSNTKLVYSNAAGGAELREAIADMQGVDADHVQIVTGASEALLILFFLAAEQGANAVLPFPAFPTMTALPESFGLESRFYLLRRESEYRIDIDEIKSLADERTKLILVNSPHNPTGATLTDEELRSLNDFAVERGIQFIVDEVYHPIYYGRETPGAAALPHATVLGDFSKAFCMSGLRVGWIIERDRKRLERYMDARSYFTISNSPLCESLATAAVQRRDCVFARARAVTSKNLEFLDKFMAEHADRLGWVRPRGGMTAFPWLVSNSDSRPFCSALAERGVLLAPGDCFGMPEHFRLGFGASGERFPEALERFADFIKHYSVQTAQA